MKDRLKEYIEKDEIYQAYKNGKLTNINDFDKFCIQHCKDIEELLEENEELNKKLYLCTPEIPQNVHGEYVSYVDLVNEIYELKKQFKKEKKEWIKLLKMFKKQQQEFIKYLEDDLKENYRDMGYRHNIYRKILEKYLEVIGNDINVGSEGGIKMNKKIISLILIGILTLTLTGCAERTSEYEASLSESYYIYIDKETCVEYFVSNGPYNMGNFSPRYNADGTLKTNKECIYKLEANKNE